MDVESDGQNASPTSPPLQTSVNSVNSANSANSVPGALESPKVNGKPASPPPPPAANGEGPVPPPHKSTPTSPAAASPPTPEDAELFKAAGNRFYKAKDYRKAIEEYTKGTI